MNPNDKTIRIITIVGTPMISSRDVIDMVASEIKKYPNKTIILDFGNIQFISRSAAHALVRLKESSQNVILNNMDAEVAEFLRTIAANMIYPKKPDGDLKYQKTTFSALLNQ